MERLGPGEKFPLKVVQFQRWSSLTGRLVRPKITVPFSEVLVSSPTSTPRLCKVAEMADDLYNSAYEYSICKLKRQDPVNSPFAQLYTRLLAFINF